MGHSILLMGDYNECIGHNPDGMKKWWRSANWLMLRCVVIKASNFRILMQEVIDALITFWLLKKSWRRCNMRAKNSLQFPISYRPQTILCELVVVCPVWATPPTTRQVWTSDFASYKHSPSHCYIEKNTNIYASIMCLRESNGWHCLKITYMRNDWTRTSWKPA